jgi:hypothetical protein
MVANGNNMTDDDSRRETPSERARLIVTIAGLIVPLLALGVAIASFVRVGHQFEQSQVIAGESPKLRLQLGSQELKPGRTTRVFLGAPVTTDKTVSIGQLPYEIDNRGEKTAEGVEVVDLLPEAGRPGFSEELFKLVKRGRLPPAKNIHHEIKQDRGYVVIHYSITSMNPGSGIKLNEPLLLEETSYENAGQPPTADRRTADLSADARSTFQGQFIISAKDQAQRTYLLALQILQAQSEEGLVDKVVKSLSEELDDERKSLSFPESFRKPLQESALIAFTERRSVGPEGAPVNIYWFNSNDVRSITVFNESNIPQYGLILLSILTGILSLVAFLRLRR